MPQGIPRGVLLGTVHPTVLTIKGQAPSTWFWKPTNIVIYIVVLVLVLVLVLVFVFVLVLILVLVLDLVAVSVFGIGIEIGFEVKLRRHATPPASFTGGPVLFAGRPCRFRALPNGYSCGY